MEIFLYWLISIFPYKSIPLTSQQFSKVSYKLFHHTGIKPAKQVATMSTWHLTDIPLSWNPIFLLKNHLYSEK